MLKKPYIPIALATALLFLWSCSAQKNTGLSRAYHNLTARYNVLFNGTESFKKGLEKIDAEFQDDYAAILPIFKYSDKDAMTIAGGDMDRTIKKCSKLISLHSITAKPKVKNNKNLTPEQRAFFSKKEYNMYVDDAYLLMGKAHFYKQEYSQASEIFMKIIADFKNQSVIYETQVWQARLSIETAQFINASDILSTLINNASFPKKGLPELYSTFADYYLRQKDYVRTIEYLEKTMVLEKRKKVRSRIVFILAQLYEKTGDLKKASEYYQQVLQMNPVYEMAFHARINRALAYEQGFGQAENIEDELHKMLRDDKNIEYQDQIYYALGNLAAKEGHEQDALMYYTQSIAANTENEDQKVRSYLTIADYYYGLPDYPYAQAYYDSALSYINPDYQGYNELFTKSKSLTRLVTEINAVKLGDSVLVLAKLPQPELNKRIDALIEAERAQVEQSRLKQQEEQLDQRFEHQAAARDFSRQTSSTSSQWYFYNDAAKSLGYQEFKLKWGNRRLEDHWQRATKSAISILPGTPDEDVAVTQNGDPKSVPGKMSREFYLADIPFTDSAVEATHKRTELALYNMGMIYKDDLKDYEQANKSFKDLIRRYPASSNLLASYYNLYSIARLQNNQALVDYYKGVIIRQFPESMYAKVLSDPEYFRELEKDEQIIRQYYSQTYLLYNSGNYAEVMSRTDYAKKTYPNHALIPRFDYLGILAEGRLVDQAIFREKLVAMVATYPGTEIADDAQNLIRYMDMEHPEYKEAEDVKISQKLYRTSPDEPHYVFFALNQRINTNQLVFNIINFNLDLFDNLSLMVEIIALNSTQNLLVIKTFPDQESTVNYLSEIRSSGDILKDMPEIALIPVAISESNLKTLKEDQSVDRYLKFHAENYR